MKKAKMMLMFIGVLALSGGMLAFRLTNVSSRVFCYTVDPNGGNPMCNTPLTQATVKLQIDAFIAYYTPVHFESECDDDTRCGFLAVLTTSDE